MKLVHWPMMGRLLQLVQRGDGAGPQPAQAVSGWTKCNSRPHRPVCISPYYMCYYRTTSVALRF